MRASGGIPRWPRWTIPPASRLLLPSCDGQGFEVCAQIASCNAGSLQAKMEGRSTQVPDPSWRCNSRSQHDNPRLLELLSTGRANGSYWGGHSRRLLPLHLSRICSASTGQRLQPCTGWLTAASLRLRTACCWARRASPRTADRETIAGPGIGQGQCLNCLEFHMLSSSFVRHRSVRLASRKG